MMVPVFVAARTEESATRFKAVNPFLKPEITVGPSSLFSWINEIVWSVQAPVALLVHDDTAFASTAMENVSYLVQQLNNAAPNWGVCGNAGLCFLGADEQLPSVIRYLVDPHGGPSSNVDHLGSIAEAVDGNTILVNVGALRDAKVKLPEVSDFQLYDLILSIEAILSGLSVYVSPLLACYHSSPGSYPHFQQALKEEAFLSYICNRISDDVLYTINGPIPISRDTSVVGRHGGIGEGKLLFRQGWGKGPKTIPGSGRGLVGKERQARILAEVADVVCNGSRADEFAATLSRLQPTAPTRALTQQDVEQAAKQASLAARLVRRVRRALS